jgi:sulfoxide reductase heme-binding subunit YedZ
MAAVLLTTALADRMRYGMWRASHYLAFPAYLLALLHGVTAGTDSGNVAAVTVYAVTASAVAGTIVWRVAGRGWTAAGETGL